MKAIATLKLKMKPKDPASYTGKQSGSCPLTGGHCTDVAGAHHSKIVEGENLANIYFALSAQGYHVTRLEIVE